MINHLGRFTWTGHNLDLNLYYSVDRQKSTTFRGGTTVNANEDRKKTLDRSISPKPAPKKTNESKRGQRIWSNVLFGCIIFLWNDSSTNRHSSDSDSSSLNCTTKFYTSLALEGSSWLQFHTHTHMRSGWPDYIDILCLELPVVCTVNLILYSPGMLTWYCCWLGI